MQGLQTHRQFNYLFLSSQDFHLLICTDLLIFKCSICSFLYCLDVQRFPLTHFHCFLHVFICCPEQAWCCRVSWLSWSHTASVDAHIWFRELRQSELADMILGNNAHTHSMYCAGAAVPACREQDICYISLASLTTHSPSSYRLYISRTHTDLSIISLESIAAFNNTSNIRKQLRQLDILSNWSDTRPS